MGRELEKLDYYWLEEPLMDPDIEGYAELTRRLEIPVIGTEWGQGGVWGVYAVPQYLVRRAVDIVRSDVSWKGGITGLLKTFIAMACGRHLFTATKISGSAMKRWLP